MRRFLSPNHIVGERAAPTAGRPGPSDEWLALKASLRPDRPSEPVVARAETLHPGGGGSKQEGVLTQPQPSVDLRVRAESPDQTRGDADAS